MLQKPRGTRDFLPDEMESRREVEGMMRGTARTWGYREICTPEFEELDLFTIRSGEGIIQEMYAFEDKGGRKLALRPELTAPVLRMYVNEGRTLPKPLRWYYFADCFRYERPQRGRYRQFWQFGAELIGADTPLAEAEIIMLAHDILSSCGIAFSFDVGHLSFMRVLLQELGPADQKRARMFLDKRDTAGLEEYLASAGNPALSSRLIDLAGCRNLGDACAITGDFPERQRIEELFGILEDAGIEYRLNPGIARGLDYYTGMVCEAFAENLGAENQVLGGGTYRLAHLFGGEDTPSCGFAIGFDRIMVARGDRRPEKAVTAGIAFTAEGRAWALAVAKQFRQAGMRTLLDLSGRSIGQQLSHISRNADYAIIIGARERDERKVTLKNLHTGVQNEMPPESALNEVSGGDSR